MLDLTRSYITLLFRVA